MVDGELLEGALELLSHAFGLRSDSTVRNPADEAPVRDLSPHERELAVAIQERRQVSIETAEDCVRWLRTQDPRFTE